MSVYLFTAFQVVFTAVLLSIFINRCAKERGVNVVAGEDEEASEEDKRMFKKNEEEWLLQAPLDDDLGTLQDIYNFSNYK